MPAAAPPPGTPRLVLDSNIVLSALLFNGGPPSRLRRLWQQAQCLPLVSAVTTHELVRVLGYPKFGLTAAEQQELLADYLPYAQAVSVPDPPPAVPHCRDLHDLPFLHLAAAGRADALITGDKDWLVLTGRTAFAILRCEAWLAAHSLTD